MAPPPRYLQIAEDLRSQIESGRIPRGDKLPKEETLGEEYGASRNTIRDAIKRLVNEKLVETRPGQGTFVSEAIVPFVTVLTAADPETGFGGGEGTAYLDSVHKGRRVPSVSPPEVQLTVPPEPVRLRLGLKEGEQTVLRRQERRIDGRPWSLQTSYYPMSFITDDHAMELMMAKDIHRGAVAYLAEHGHKQKGYRDWITGRTANDDEQRFFRIDHGAAVFEVFRTAFDLDNNPMRVTVTVFPIDRNQFIADVGEDLPAPEFKVIKATEVPEAGGQDA